MINLDNNSESVVYVHPQTGYFLASGSNLYQFLIEQRCTDCFKMSRVAMSCYAATKHSISDKTETRKQPPNKPNNSKHESKYGDFETELSLDKYNGKMMFSIWGLYNRNSPHNFKKQNAEATINEQEMTEMEAKFKTSLVQFTIPQFTGIVSVETNIEVKKPRTTLEKLESLFSFPIF